MDDIRDNLLFILVPTQILGNIFYVITKSTNQSATYYLTLHILPQIIGFLGLLKEKYWAWLLFISVTGYNAFDFSKSMLISPGIFQEHFRIFMIITIFVNLVLIIALISKKDYYE